MSGLPRLTITGGPTIRQMSVQLDGWEVPGLLSATIYMTSDSLVEASFSLAVDGVDIDTEALAVLTAEVERRAASE